MRSPASMDIIQIDITHACHKRCGGCTRVVAHYKDPPEMTVEQFAAAVDSMEGWSNFQDGKILGVMGGEPTMHPQFDEIAAVFYEKWGRGSPADNGLRPIDDFARYAQERLADRSSGRGLWSSLGNAYYRNYETIQEVFDHQCINDHENPGVHQALFITRTDMGIPDDEWVKLRDNCWVQNLWSASITSHGAYFCEVAGALDALYYGGAHAWPVEKGWWKRTPDQFGDQLKLCEHCGLCLPGPSIVANDDRDLISASQLKLLEKAESPAVKKGKFTLYDPEIHTEKRVVSTKQSYMPSPELRVDPENKSIRPRSVTAIVTCVGRSESLKQTMRESLDQVDRMVVVTVRGDRETQEAVHEVRRGLYKLDRLLLVTTEDGYSGDHAFNKGRLINTGLRSACHHHGSVDWILLTDADVLLANGLLSYVKRHSINPGCLYYVGRRHTDGRPQTVEDHEPNGYFQLFHHSAWALKERQPGWLLSESFCSAGGVDSWLMLQYEKKKRVRLGPPSLDVLHISHGDFASGWNGSRKGWAWRQVGVVSGHAGLVRFRDWDRSSKLLLTDAATGKQTETPGGGVIPGETLRIRDGVIHFMGEPTDPASHIHLAAWTEE